MTLALPRVRPLAVPLSLTAVAVAAQLAYPLTDGQPRDVLTAVVVTTLAAAALTHTSLTRGPAAALRLFAVTALVGFAFEVLGVHTGMPFGRYAYSGELGAQLLGVPPLIGLAWTMLAWPAFAVAERAARSTAGRVAVAALTLTGLDLFLDPQMVRAGYWRWAHTAPHLPGVPQVPLTNLAGWLTVSAVIAALYFAGRRDSLGADRGDDRLPCAVLAWLYLGWIVALAVFGGQPAAAGWGALALAPAASIAVRALRDTWELRGR